MYKKLWLVTVGIVALLLAFRLQPVPTATAQSPLPPSPLAIPMSIAYVEPHTLLTTGGALSIYGAGFDADCVARLVGHGLLATTFVNETALTAQIPAGLEAGTYVLVVTNGAAAVELQNAFAIVAPSPTPAPTEPPAPPPPGRPILTIRNYRVEPAQVRAGQEFTVAIEIYNNGSRAGENTMAVFPGATFVPVGEPGHLLWQLPINHTAVVTQKLRAPASLGSGVHQVQINLSANDWEGAHYEYPQTVPVEVVGRTPVAGQPKVTIESATTSPPLLAPGAPFTLTLRLANRGSRTALNVFAACASEDRVIPAAGSDAVSTPRIGIEETVTVTLPFLLDSTIPGGRQKLAIALAYEDPGGGAHTNQETIGVNVDASLASQPQLLIQSYHTTPDFLRPGDVFTLSVEIANVGGGDAHRLTLALGGEGGAALDPFSPLQAGNVDFVDRVGGGASTTIHWRMMVDGAAQAKAYNLPLTLAYDDAQNGRRTDTQRLSLIVRRQPEMQATFYREPEGLTVGATSDISLEILNIGSSTVNIIRLTATGDRMDITAEGTPFMGPVESGGSAPLDITVAPREAGQTDIVVHVTYRDSFNQSQTLTTTIAVDVMGGAPGGGPAAPVQPGAAPKAESAQPTLLGRIGKLVKGFLGFGS